MSKRTDFAQRICAVLVLTLAPLITIASPQSAGSTDASFRFEVATIKPASPDARGNSINNRPGIFEVRNGSVRSLVQYGYSIHPAQVIGGPDWINSDRFDITAKLEQQESETDPNRVSTRDKRGRSAVRALLVERFQLRLRQESRELPVYSLIVDKGGHKLTPSATGAGRVFTSSSNAIRTMNSEGFSSKGIAENFSFLDRPVLDETGLSGLFDFKLTWSDSLDADATAPSIFTAVREQLGLKLEAKKGQVGIYVIEKVEKPSGN